MTVPTELEVLVEQLDELLSEGATDWDAALEIAMVAGLAARLGADASVLAPAEAWRDDLGEELLEEAFQEIDPAKLVAAIDEVSTGGADEEEIEEAIGDFDDLVAAAAWAGRVRWIRPHARQVAQILRTLPDAFAPLAADGKAMARTRPVAEDPDLYDYWLAIADAEMWAD